MHLKFNYFLRSIKYSTPLSHRSVGRWLMRCRRPSLFHQLSSSMMMMTTTRDEVDLSTTASDYHLLSCVMVGSSSFGFARAGTSTFRFISVRNNDMQACSNPMASSSSGSIIVVYNNGQHGDHQHKCSTAFFCALSTLSLQPASSACHRGMHLCGSNTDYGSDFYFNFIIFTFSNQLGWVLTPRTSLAFGPASMPFP